jgi:hypothetical protein
MTEAAVDRERPSENRRSSQGYEMVDPGFADSTRIEGPVGKRAVPANDSDRQVTCILIRGGDSQRLHFAIQVAAFEAQSRGRLRHIPAVLLQFS